MPNSKSNRDELIKNLPKVEDIELKKNMKISELMEEFGRSGGFTAKKLYTAAQILKEMIKDEKSLNFLSFPACIVSTGVRGVIKEALKNKFFDIVITTCGTLDHDIARCWKTYLHGWFEADDTELAEMDIFRLGNVFIPSENYGAIIEEIMQDLLKKLYNAGIRELATYELSEKIGEYIDRNCPNKEDSILWWAWKNKIKIIIPGITDGAVGYQLWLFYQDHKDFKINVLKDEQYLSDVIYDAERTGTLIVGGGISKHHVIWWNQFKEGLDRVVYITTAVEWDGSLSGARTREAISWGKIGKKASHITVEGDATVLLPMIIAYLIDKI